MDFVAACTKWTNNKPCPIMYCHKCLLNRYGKKAEEVAASGDWSCPRCKGICNCSYCMKKRGHQPTGILIKTAKATGFSSVSEMLLKGNQYLNCETVVALTVDSPKMELAPSPKKWGKGNSFDGNVNANLLNDIGKKSRKVKKADNRNKDDGTSIGQGHDKRKFKQETLLEMQDCNKKLEAGDSALCGAKKLKQMKRDRSDDPETKEDNDEILKGHSVNDGKKKQKKSRKKGFDNDGSRINATLARRTSPRKLTVSNGISNQEARLRVGVDDGKMNCRIEVTKKDFVKHLENDTTEEGAINTTNALVGFKLHSAVIFPNIPLPRGTALNSVAGIDLSIEDVGNALQFLEFCAAFGKILEVENNQPKQVLLDLFHRRTGRPGKFSATVQFLIHLLSILQTEQGEECGELSASVINKLWFDALKECFSESQSILKSQGLDCLEKASDYESLDASKKLRLLNFLCDEILGTEKVRSWMDEQHTEHAKKVKEAKQKEKTLKQKMKDNVAEAIIAKHGAPLSISEHEAIVSLIKHWAAEAHTKVVLESNGLLENTQTCNAIRIEPVLVDHDGNAFWKLNCSGNSNVLHQDVGKGDNLSSNEKWLAIGDEGKEEIEKYICSLGGNKIRL